MYDDNECCVDAGDADEMICGTCSKSFGNFLSFFFSLAIVLPESPFFGLVWFALLDSTLLTSCNNLFGSFWCEVLHRDRNGGINVKNNTNTNTNNNNKMATDKSSKMKAKREKKGRLDVSGKRKKVEHSKRQSIRQTNSYRKRIPSKDLH